MAVQVPHWVLFIRIGQGIATLLVLALTAYAASVFGVFSGFGLDWFVSLWTFAFLGFTLFIRPRLSQSWANNAIVPLIPELATAFWWLITFAVIASEAVALSAFGDFYYGGAAYGDIYGSGAAAALGCTRGAAGIGALIFISFLATIGLYVAAMLKGKREGNSSNFNSNFNHVSGEPKPTQPLASANNNTGYYPQQPQQQQQNYQFQNNQPQQQQYPAQPMHV